MVARPVPVWCGTTISAVIAERNIEEVNKPAICARRRTTNCQQAAPSIQYNRPGKKGKKRGEKREREKKKKKKKKNERQGKKYAFPCAL